MRGDLLDFEPISIYEGDSFKQPGWSLIVPKNSSVGSGPVETDFGSAGQPYWFVAVQTAAGSASLPPAVPFTIGGEYPQMYESTASVNVSGKYQVTRRTVRASFDICKFATFAQVAGGWPYLTSFQVVTSLRAYQFLILTDQPDAVIIQKIIDSIGVD